MIVLQLPPGAESAAGRPDGLDVLDDCHRETLRMLVRLEKLLERLEAIGADPQARATAAAIERHFSTTVRRHHEDEERHVFPALALGGDAETLQTLARLQQDHAWMNADWAELQPQIEAIACGLSWVDAELLRNQAAVLAQLVREHIAQEESLVYPRFRGGLTEMAHRRMNDEMQSRRLEAAARTEAVARA